MLNLAPAARDLKAAKLERALRATGFTEASSLAKEYGNLFSTAEEACPGLPASRCDQLVRFYFTAVLAATEITPAFSEKWSSHVTIDAAAGTGKTFTLLFPTNRWLQADLRPPHTPQFLPTTFGGTAATGFLEPRINREFFAEPDLTNFMVISRRVDANPAHHSPARAPIKPFKAFADLKEWLQLSSKQLTTLLGIKRTTPNAWDREGRSPRPATQLRLDLLHRYISDLAGRPDASEQLRRIRPALPTLMKAIEAEASLTSTTLDDAKIEMPFDWRKLNAFQAAYRIAVTAHEDGSSIAQGTAVEAMVVEEDEDDLDLLY